MTSTDYLGRYTMSKQFRAAFYATLSPIWRLPTVKGHGVGLILQILCSFAQYQESCCLDNNIS